MPTMETENFIAQSRKAMFGSQRLRRIALSSIIALMMAVILGLVGWINQEYLKAQWRWYSIERPFLAVNMRPYVLTPAAEVALKPDPDQSFRECAPKQEQRDFCPDMVVVPAGSFMMGSPATEKGHRSFEEPQHMVAIARPFAVSKYELTFDEWDTCVD